MVYWKRKCLGFFTRELNDAMENFILLLAATEGFFHVMLDINHIFCI